jgi:hypothetical protein
MASQERLTAPQAGASTITLDPFENKIILIIYITVK